VMERRRRRGVIVVVRAGRVAVVPEDAELEHGLRRVGTFLCRRSSPSARGCGLRVQPRRPHTSARKEPVQPSRWMTRPVEPCRGYIAAGSTCSLDSRSHAAAAALALALPLSRRRSRAWMAAHKSGD
jgi:hypothetical protein